MLARGHRRESGAMKPRDMSIEQFQAACERHGFVRQGFMGYFNLGIPGQSVSASIFNAGDNRRAQLAYLLRERDRFTAQEKLTK